MISQKIKINNGECIYIIRSRGQSTEIIKFEPKINLNK